jgi:hypothetical protein
MLQLADHCFRQEWETSIIIKIAVQIHCSIKISLFMIWKYKSHHNYDGFCIKLSEKFILTTPHTVTAI